MFKSLFKIKQIFKSLLLQCINKHDIAFFGKLKETANLYCSYQVLHLCAIMCSYVAVKSQLQLLVLNYTYSKHPK